MSNPRDTQSDPQRVKVEPVMTAREHLGWAALTALASAVTVAFAASWSTLWRAPGPRLGFVIVVLVLAFFTTSWFGRWLLLPRMRRPVPMPAQPGLRVAVVTTIVPSTEPIGMLEQCLRAVVAIEYPHDSWVLDEENSPEVAALCQRLGAGHFSRLPSTERPLSAGRLRKRTKHGNYNAWLSVYGDQYDILTHFDPDHVPEPEFLTRVLPYFRDPGVAFVQAPQVYYNQDVSYVARGAAEESYAFYSSHQPASFGMGHAIFVGCHGTHRMTALQSVEGFADHDADDLLLTLRYRGAGWRGVYVPEILAMGLTPVDWFGYLRQQVRWTRSVIDLKLYRLPTIRLPRIDKALGFLHGVHYLRPFMLPVVYAMFAGLALGGVEPAFMHPRPLAELVGLWVTLSLIGRFQRRYALDPQREGGLHWRAFVLEFGKWPYQVIAGWRALIRSSAPYALTNKLPPSEGGYRVLWVLWLVPIGLGAALGIGVLRHGTIPPSILYACLISATASGALALSESRVGPDRWIPELYHQRHTQWSNARAARTGPEATSPSTRHGHQYD